MILTEIGFGVYITCEFGSPIKGREPLFKLCNETKYNDTEWSFYCPSVENIQYVLGFKTTINKNSDFKQLAEKWQARLKNAPAAVQTAWLASGSPEPDVVFLSGHC